MLPAAKVNMSQLGTCRDEKTSCFSWSADTLLPQAIHLPNVTQARRDIGPRSFPTTPTRWSTLSSSIIGMIDAERPIRMSQSPVFRAYVSKTLRSAGTRMATRWMAALSATAAMSGTGKSGFIAKAETVAERQFHAWKSGESARREKAIARAYAPGFDSVTPDTSQFQM